MNVGNRVKRLQATLPHAGERFLSIFDGMPDHIRTRVRRVLESHQDHPNTLLDCLLEATCERIAPGLKAWVDALDEVKLPTHWHSPDWRLVTFPKPPAVPIGLHVRYERQATEPGIEGDKAACVAYVLRMAEALA